MSGDDWEPVDDGGDWALDDPSARVDDDDSDPEVGADGPKSGPARAVRGTKRSIAELRLSRVRMACSRDGKVLGSLVRTSRFWNLVEGLYVQCPSCGEVQRVVVEAVRKRPQPSDQVELLPPWKQSSTRRRGRRRPARREEPRKK